MIDLRVGTLVFEFLVFEFFKVSLTLLPPIRLFPLIHPLHSSAANRGGERVLDHFALAGGVWA